MLESVTLTGIDERTSVCGLVNLWTRYPWLEFAVLASGHSGEQPRFPRLDDVVALREISHALGKRAALHLCGRLARAVALGSAEEATALARGFGRVQINLPPALRREHASEIRVFQKAVGCPVIVQHNKAPWTASALDGVDGIEHLWDRSGGRGQADLASWPPPPGTGRVGYAGGLGPQNIEAAVAFTGRFPSRPTWLDMESRVRTRDWFDVEIAGRICKTVNQRLEQAEELRKQLAAASRRAPRNTPSSAQKAKQQCE